MNVSPSQCSVSGSESGWTLYLDQSYPSANQCQRASGVFEDACGGSGGEAEEDEEEDLSMVSDASSGPPHLLECDDCFDGNGCFFSASSTSEFTKKGDKKMKIREHRGKQQHAYLDDTASSPVESFSKKKINVSSGQASMQHVVDFSQGFSATHLKGSASLRKHFGFLQPSLSENPGSGKPGGFQGKWE